MTESAVRARIELFEPVQTQSAVYAVIDQLVDLIHSGRLPVGTLLPGERKLAEATKVSRRTIREAIELMREGGVLTVEPGPGGGTTVASIWVPEELMRLKDPNPITADEVFGLLEARRTIEPRVAHLAAMRGTSEDFRIMENTIAFQRANSDDEGRLSQGNAIFHRQLWRAAGNRELESAMRSIYRALAVPFAAALQQDESPLTGIELHEETLHALRLGDSQLIEEVMDRHLAYLEQRCEVAFGRSRIRGIPQFLTGPSPMPPSGV